METQLPQDEDQIEVPPATDASSEPEDLPVASADEELLDDDAAEQDPDDEAEGEAPVPFEPVRVDVDGLNIQTPTKNDPVMRNLTDEDRAKYLATLSMAYTNIREIRRFNETFQNQVTPAVTGEQLEEWLSAVNQATATTLFSDDYFERAIQRQNGNWDQAIVTDKGTRHAMGLPKVQPITDGEKLVGEAALMRISAMSGTGGTVYVPLPHTGIWLTMKTPTLEAMTELDARIAQRKVDLGRSTRGLVFSNHQVYIAQELIQFALDHVIDCNVADWTTEGLIDLIVQPDLQILALGIAYAIYRSGFPISQPCTFDVTKCMHITEKLVNLNRLLRVDNNMLTAKQRTRMSMMRERNTSATLTAYRDEFSTPESVTAELVPGTKVVFKLPTLRDHLSAGDRWISQIVENTEKVLGPNVTPRDRNEYINRQARASAISQYIHYIDKFILEEDGAQATIDGRDDIERICVQLSSDSEIINTFVSSVIKYINDTTVALAAIPNYPCSNCGKWHRSDHAQKFLIPVDAVTTFFTLLQLKLVLMGIRQVG